MVDSAQGAAAAVPSFASDPAASRPQFNRKRPYRARICGQKRLTGESSSKEVWQVSLRVDPSQLEALPGDTLGVLAPAPVPLVDGLLEVLGRDGSEPHRGALNLRDALMHHLEVSMPSPRLLRLLPVTPSVSVPYPDVLDIFTQLRGDVSAATLLSTLRPTAPRAFSVSSYSTNGNIDLTVARLRTTHLNRERHGIASEFLIAAAPEAGINLFPIPHPSFRLPDDERPLILIGAGTGIAPFRGFLTQMSATRPRRAWLVFGDRNRSTDFLYGDELTQALRAGLLTRLDLAFSRDGTSPRYVQDALAEQAKTVVEWVSQGARIYVCGHSAMANGVEVALEKILDEARLAGSPAVLSVSDLRANERYLTDVYDT